MIKNSLDLLCLLEKIQAGILAFRPSQPPNPNKQVRMPRLHIDSRS
jgi:hypothetical protein